MTRFALPLLLALATFAFAAPPKRQHPMVGDWAGVAKLTFKTPGKRTEFGAQPLAFKLTGAPTSLGKSAGGPCDLRLVPDGDDGRRVVFTKGQACTPRTNGVAVSTKVREGAIEVVEGTLELSLILDAANGDVITMFATLAPRKSPALARWN